MYLSHFQLHWLPRPCIAQYLKRKRQARAEEERKRTHDEKIRNAKLKENNLPPEVIETQKRNSGTNSQSQST